jgi:site-specific recombinase XerD
VFWIEEDLLTDRQMAFFARGRVPAPKVPQEIRPTYDPLVLAALLGADGPKPRLEAAARDKAIIHLLHDSGMRVAELCGLRDQDMRYAERQAVVTGKGKKQRYVFWTEATHAALESYLPLRPGDAGGPLFRAVGRGGRGGKSFGQGINPDMVRAMLVRRAARAGVELPAAAVHALRHTFAHRFLDQGGDGLYLQQILGHESIVTTMRYVRENPTGLRKTYRRVMGA